MVPRTVARSLQVCFLHCGITWDSQHHFFIFYLLIKINPKVVLYFFFDSLFIHWGCSKFKSEFFTHVADRAIASVKFILLMICFWYLIALVIFHLPNFANFYSLIKSLIILTYFFFWFLYSIVSLIWFMSPISLFKNLTQF